MQRANCFNTSLIYIIHCTLSFLPLGILLLSHVQKGYPTHTAENEFLKEKLIGMSPFVGGRRDKHIYNVCYAWVTLDESVQKQSNLQH